MKKCFKCNEVKPLTEFYAHPQMKDGHVNKCKDCNKRDVKGNYNDNTQNPLWKIVERDRCRKKQAKRRESGLAVLTKEQVSIANKTYKDRYPEKYKAHILAQRIPTKPCQVCGDTNVERHHEDYSKPMDVMFLCTKHHAELHVLKREAELLEKHKQ